MTTRTAAGGFTLLEVILAVALVSIVTVAIASIFATVGETVTAGQRLSNVNRVAARVERVMRRDFDRMVRTEGFLVIANEITRYRSNEIAALDPVLVGLTPDDELPRPRRIDQIMFFARDDFATLRAPLDPALVARSDTARIYYGHGQRLPVDLGGADSPDNPIDDTTFLTPRVSLPITDPNLNAPATGVIGVDQSPLLQDSRLGVVAEQFDNPNQFATDWSLLRHVTLLSPPRPRLSDLPPTLVGFTLTAAQQSELLDSPRQIAAQPAQMSLFRSLAVTEPPLSQLADSGFAPFVRTIVGLGADLDGASGSTGVLARPTAQSGIVDIAATTLDDVDAIVRGPLDRSGNAIIPPLGINRSATLDSQLSLFGTGDFGAVVDGFRGTGVLATQAWMLDGLPSEVWSYQTRDPVSGRVEGSRIRYELSPTRTLGLSSDDNPQQRAASAYRLADQDMLSSFVFLPRCTEFIVEFSFGIIDNRETVDGFPNPGFGAPIWHGIRRWGDTPGGVDGLYEPARGERLIADYWEEDGLLDGENDLPQYDDTLLEQRNDFVIPREFWDDEDDDDPAAILPRFDPTRASVVQFPLTGAATQLITRSLQGQSGSGPSIAYYTFGQTLIERDGGDFETDRLEPWPWPKLIRVTFRFADEADLSSEQTYQVTFRVPDVDGL